MAYPIRFDDPSAAKPPRKQPMGLCGDFRRSREHLIAYFMDGAPEV